ncbi:MAG: hypothetical protein ACHQFZ_02155 [Acidimicrobiales bacterium]
MSVDRVRPARRSTAVIVTAVVALSVVSPLAGSSAASTARKAHLVVATGSVTCTKVTGSITYRPPIHHVGTVPETQVFTFHASRCSTKGSNVHRVSSGSLTASVHRPLNSCIDLLVHAKLSSGTGTWIPKSIHPTTAHFSGFAFVYNAAGDVGFALPNPGGTATVRGSFAGRDHGARSTVTVYTNFTPAQFRDQCLAPAGVARESLVSGRAFFS